MTKTTYRFRLHFGLLQGGVVRRICYQESQPTYKYKIYNKFTYFICTCWFYSHTEVSKDGNGIFKIHASFILSSYDQTCNLAYMSWLYDKIPKNVERCISHILFHTTFVKLSVKQRQICHCAQH